MTRRLRLVARKAPRPTGSRWFAHVLEHGGFCLVYCPHYLPRRRPLDCAHGYGCCDAITPQDCPWGGFDDWVGMKEGGW